MDAVVAIESWLLQRRDELRLHCWLILSDDAVLMAERVRVRRRAVAGARDGGSLFRPLLRQINSLPASPYTKPQMPACVGAADTLLANDRLANTAHASCWKRLLSVVSSQVEHFMLTAINCTSDSLRKASWSRRRGLSDSTQ